MKLFIKHSILFIIISSNLCACTAQNSDKKLTAMKAAFDKLPTYFPLSKDGFYRVSSAYGLRKHPILKTNKFHSGLDLAAKKGSPIYASANGKIIVSTYSKGYGNYVIIDHNSGYKTLYGHMSKTNVKKNQIVKQGNIIGYVGSTGRSTGPHLHYEIIKSGKKIDPFSYWLNTLKLRKKLIKS